MWKGALHIMKEHPLLGVGTGGYRIAMKRFETKLQQVGYQDINNPHSSFFYMTVSFGFLGLALLLWLFYALLKKGWQARDTRAGFAVLVYGVIVIMVGLTSTTIIDFATSNMMSLMFGIRTPEE
jgi:O-antigen ligase